MSHLAAAGAETSSASSGQHRPEVEAGDFESITPDKLSRKCAIVDQVVDICVDLLLTASAEKIAMLERKLKELEEEGPSSNILEIMRSDEPEHLKLRKVLTWKYDRISHDEASYMKPEVMLKRLLAMAWSDRKSSHSASPSPKDLLRNFAKLVFSSKLEFVETQFFEDLVSEDCVGKKKVDAWVAVTSAALEEFAKLEWSMEPTDKYTKRYLALLDEFHKKAKESMSKIGVFFPCIVTVGHQSVGKSSILDTITRLQLFPTGAKIKTRCPVRLALRQRTPEEMKSLIVKAGNQKSAALKREAQENKVFRTYAAAGIVVQFANEPDNYYVKPETIRKRIEALTDENTRSDAGLVCIRDIPIELTLYGTTIPNLTLLDLPGIIESPLQGQSPDIAAESKKLATKYCQAKESILMVVFRLDQLMDTNLFSMMTAHKIPAAIDPGCTRLIPVCSFLDSDAVQKDPSLAAEVLKGSAHVHLVTSSQVQQQPPIIAIRCRQGQESFIQAKEVEDSVIQQPQLRPLQETGLVGQRVLLSRLIQAQQTLLTREVRINFQKELERRLEDERAALREIGEEPVMRTPDTAARTLGQVLRRTKIIVSESFAASKVGTLASNLQGNNFKVDQCIRKVEQVGQKQIELVVQAIEEDPEYHISNLPSLKDLLQTTFHKVLQTLIGKLSDDAVRLEELAKMIEDHVLPPPPPVSFSSFGLTPPALRKQSKVSDLFDLLLPHVALRWLAALKTALLIAIDDLPTDDAVTLLTEDRLTQEERKKHSDALLAIDDVLSGLRKLDQKA